MADPQGSDPDSPFAKLPPGRTSRSPEETALHRRRRLMGAMVELVARKGYRSTTLRELVALAGVSNTSFYEQFRSVQECFLATYEELLGGAIEEARRAYLSEEDSSAQLHAGLARFADLAVEHPETSHLVVVDVLSLGAVGVRRQQRSIEAFEVLLRGALEKGMAKPEDLSELTVRGVVGGIERIFHRALWTGRSEQLREYVAPLVDWGVSYQGAGPPADWHLPSAGPMAPRGKVAPAVPEAPAAEMWDEERKDSAELVGLSQRQRIVRAAALVVAKKGYARLSIPAITAGAGVSNKTFYEQFESAEGAFVEALELLDLEASSRVASAVQARWTWPEAVVAELDALLTFTSEKPLLSRLPFIESLSAGGAALGRLEQMQDRFLSMFNPKAVPAELGEPLPEVVVDAISGGIFAVIQHEVVNGRAQSVGELLPELSFFALAPLSANPHQGQS